MQKTILKTIVGSQAHGLATPESDTDYRGVFVVPTSEILSLNNRAKNTHWIEGAVDDTTWELGHFLHLALHCNPTILETFLAPVAESTPWGDELRALFPYVWNSVDVRNAFIGYGLNQRKKFLDGKDKKPNKFAVAWLRVLYQATELLQKGTFTVRIADSNIGERLWRWKNGDFSLGEVVDLCAQWERNLNSAFEFLPNKVADPERINDFLLKVRRENW